MELLKKELYAFLEATLNKVKESIDARGSHVSFGNVETELNRKEFGISRVV